MTKMLFISTGTEEYAQSFDISHIIIASIVSEIRPIAHITLHPLLSTLKDRHHRLESAYLRYLLAIDHFMLVSF